MSFFQTFWGLVIAFFRSFQTITIEDPENHLILITGCDSGFGLLTTHRLLQLRYYVIALCLTEKGVTDLTEYAKANGYTRLIALQCDVSKEEDLRKVYDKVSNLLKTDDKLKLWAIVNNAGIAPSGFTDWLSIDAFRRTMEVNFFAIVIITKLFLQILKKFKDSRIINICSMAGFVGGPNGGPYCASKHAIEGFVKCLRLELLPWNIHVTNINPGFMNTGIVQKSTDYRLKEWEKVPKEIREQYPFENLTAGDAAIDHVTEDATYVVNCIVENITAAAPLLNNFPGVNTKIASWGDWLMSGLGKHLFGVWMVKTFNYGPYPDVVKEFQNKQK